MIGLGAVDPSQATAHEQLMVGGDVLSLCARHAESIGTGLGAVREFRKEALEAYNAAVSLTWPGSEAACSVAELLMDAAKSELAAGDPDRLGSGMLQQARDLFTAAIAANPNDGDCNYNLACVNAIGGDEAGCRAALQSAMALAPDRAVFLGEVGRDPDFTPVRTNRWFQELVQS